MRLRPQCGDLTYHHLFFLTPLVHGLLCLEKALKTAERDLMLALDSLPAQQEECREGEMYEGEAVSTHTVAKTAEKGVQIDANEAGGTVDGYGCVMDQDVEVRLGQEAKHHAVQAELIAVRAQHEDLMHERDILAAEVAVQEKIFTSII